MQVSAGQYATRLSCGLGLLFLLAVPQKVHSRPIPKKSEPRQPAEPVPGPTPNEQPKRKPKKPLTLTATLPDVVPPRWPSHVHLTAVQRGRPLPAATWRKGPAGFSDESAKPAGIDAIFGGGWPRKPAPQPLPASDKAEIRFACARAHLFQTSILRTGPPSAQSTESLAPSAPCR